MKKLILKYLLEKANLDFEAGRFDSELKKLYWVILLNPTAFNYSLRGGVNMKANRLDKAIEDYTKAIEIDPNLMEYYCSRAYCYSLDNQNDLSIKDYDSAIRIAPNEFSLFLYRAQSFEDNQDFENAISDYNIAISKDPNEIEAYIGKGICLARLKKYSKAISTYNAGLKIDPETTEFIVISEYL